MEDVALGPSATLPQPQAEEEVCIEIRDAVKIYAGNNVVFRGLNMTVPKGKM